jgi:energy-coupling factor transporter ATP-binding protein EcfA2
MMAGMQDSGASGSDDSGTTRGGSLVARVEHLAALADRRAELLRPGAAEPVVRRARELREHARSYLLPRARDLDAPIVVLLLGPTGSGKSTLLNTIAEHRASETGVLRPTTRHAVVLATPDDAERIRAGGAFEAVDPTRVRAVPTGARPGVVVVDAPDIDSVEHPNRALAETLLELADLCVLVTTATRYADRVPWDILARVEQRGLPLLVVVNRLPSGPDRDAVLADVERLFATRSPTLARQGLGRPLEVIGVDEGARMPPTESLDPDAVAPLLSRIDRLASDRDARRALAERALAGAVAGMDALVNEVADDLEHAAIDVDALRRSSATDHQQELERLLDRVGSGRVLREEVLRQWHTFVGADQVTRAFSSGIGRVRGAVSSLFRSVPPPPVAQVEEGVADELSALVMAHASEAARRTAARWAADATAAPLLDERPDLWSSSPDLPAATREALDEWLRSIAADVAATGATKRGLARGLSVGVNAGAVTVMLGVFAHTGGITGAEVGIAAATAFLNQKLLNALFGEAAVLEMIDRARDGLRDALTGLMARERQRFDGLLPAGDELRALAGDLRAVVAPSTPASR